MAGWTAGWRLGWAAASTVVLVFGAAAGGLHPARAAGAERPGSADMPPSGSAALASPIADDLGPDCVTRPGAMRRARDLLDGTLILSRHEPTRLPDNPTWAEDPFDDRNWEFQYHSLRFTWDLFEAWRQTGERAYRDRALFLLRDWVRDNPPGRGRSDFSWNDHSTAWRTVVLACAVVVRPGVAWIREALRTHAAVLADPGFYVGVGNHALNQSRGLLAAACVLDRPDWRRLAARRIGRLIETSVDREGVTNEQAVFYQLYNLEAYRAAADRLNVCGESAPPAFERLDLMTDFLTHATLPDGAYATLGDTSHTPARSVPGTTAEFAATAGQRGPRPTTRFAIFRAGFVFGRTGWGEQRPWAHEMVWTGRFGPGRQFHGHLDHGAVTLFAYGRRLVDDPGLFTLNADGWRSFAIGRSAHNVVTVDGLAYDSASRTRLVRSASKPAFDDVTLRDPGYDGVDLRRRIVFSRAMGWLLVDDAAKSATARAYRQLWHLLPGANARRDGSSVRTHQPGGNLLILQLRSPETTRVLEGRRSPIQGWYSTGLNKREPAPVVEATMVGTSARYVTLLVPLAYCGADVRIGQVSVTPDEVAFTLRVDGEGERVSIAGRSVTLTPVPARTDGGAALRVRRPFTATARPTNQTTRRCSEG